MGVGDGVDPTILTSLDGSIRIRGGGAVDLGIAASGTSSAFIPPGPNRAAVIEPLVTAGLHNLTFGDGIYLFEHSLFAGFDPALLQDIRLIGLGDDRTVWTASYAPAIGLADSFTNALVSYMGVVTPTVSTTVAAGIAAIVDSATFTVTSAVGIVAGMFLRIQANNAPGNPSDALSMSDGINVILTEMVEVESVLGAVVTLVSPLKQWHTPGATVVSVSPARGLTMRGIYLDCFNGTIATGLSTALAADILIEECAIRGFSRAGFDLELGTRSIDVNGVRSHGQVNSSLIGDSIMLADIQRIVTDEQGERFHPNGIARHSIKFFERCTAIQVHDCTLQHACAGICNWGGWHIQWSDIQIRDMDPARIRVTDPFYPLGGSALGVGVDMGESFLNDESFAYAISYSNIQVHDCFGLVAYDMGWFLHDAWQVQLSDVGIYTHGPVSGSVINGVTYNSEGIWINDIFQGVIESLYVSGCNFGMRVTGGPEVSIHEYIYDGTAGNGSAVVGIFYDCTGAMRIDKYRQGNGGGVYFGPTFSAAPNYDLNVIRYELDGVGIWSDLFLYRNNSGGVVGTGDVLQVDAASPLATRRFVNSTGPSALNVVNALPAIANNDFTWCTLLPARAASVMVLGAAAAGTVIEANAANQGVPNAGAADGTRIGRIMSTKGAGAALVPLGTVN